MKYEFMKLIGVYTRVCVLTTVFYTYITVLLANRSERCSDIIMRPNTRCNLFGHITNFAFVTGLKDLRISLIISNKTVKCAARKITNNNNSIIYIYIYINYFISINEEHIIRICTHGCHYVASINYNILLYIFYYNIMLIYFVYYNYNLHVIIHIYIFVFVLLRAVTEYVIRV